MLLLLLAVPVFVEAFERVALAVAEVRRRVVLVLRAVVRLLVAVFLALVVVVALVASPVGTAFLRALRVGGVFSPS